MALGTAAILTALILARATFTRGFNVSSITFDEGFTPLFGEKNIVQSASGRTVQILLDKFSGSGFISSGLYYNGFFSASIKLPSDFTAGVVVAFYMSNGDIFEKNHDELDFEFLGNVRGKEWRVQTNVYGNGSTNRGREERYQLPFDPTAEAHRYTILWTQTNIVFYIDDSPIREVVRSESMGGDYPSKPMSVYATIWDGSAWATSGGRYKVDYKYAPFIAEFTGLALQGCRLDPVQQLPAADQCRDAANYSSLSPEKRQAMLRFRENYMTYTCCYDNLRYPVPLPDCHMEESQKKRYSESGEVKVQPKQIYTSYVRRQRGRSGRRGRLKSSRAAASGKRVQALA